ncbi:MAG: tetratricopeptide repeat protein [Gemmataceae bacterium]|nr:tetratricopeptide repeat protein [Gemmataceae bacterium]
MLRRAIFWIAPLSLASEWSLYRDLAQSHFDFHLREAQVASQNHRHELAARHAVRAAAFRRRDGQVRLLAARLLRRAELPTEAKPHLETARKRLGDHPEVDLEQLLNAVQLGQASELVERSLYRRAQRDPNHRCLILEALSVSALSRFRIDQARAWLDEWLSAEVQDPRPHFWRGLALQQMGGYQEDAALADFRRAVALNPDYDEARLRLAQLLVKKNAHAEAAGHFQTLLARQPRNAAAMVGLARCQSALGDGEASRGLLEQALGIQPDHVDALRELGILLLNEGRAEEALPLLRRANQLDPSDPYASFNLMQCLQQLGRDEEARRQKARHEALASRHERTLKLLAELQARPKDPDLLSELGILYLQAGRPDADAAGVWFLQQAIQMAPRHPQAVRTLAEYFERTGRRDLASELRHRLK